MIGNPLVLLAGAIPGRALAAGGVASPYHWLARTGYRDDTASQRHVFVPVNSDGLRPSGRARRLHRRQ